VSPERTSIGCAVAALAACGGALASVVRGYPHALDTSCPNGAPAPAAFWSLIVVAVALAVVAFGLRPRRRTEQGTRSGADAFALFVVIAVPLAALVTVFGFWFTYACWE
jgi:hypothetical protein